MMLLTPLTLPHCSHSGYTLSLVPAVHEGSSLTFWSAFRWPVLTGVRWRLVRLTRVSLVTNAAECPFVCILRNDPGPFYSESTSVPVTQL